jgi:guanine deaminase
MQTHISENKREVAWMKELFPERRNYLDIYDHHGLVGPRAVFGHGIWLEESELQRLHEGGSAISHCPTSNLFLGSGAFSLRRALDSRRPVRVGIGTDIGAGTSFSILATMGEAYKVALQHQDTLSAEHALYLATRGGARAMYLDDRIGSLASGLEADIAVLDMKSTPLIAYRMEQAQDLRERLFVQMTLGDDRAIRATYVAGKLAYKRRR